MNTKTALASTLALLAAGTLLAACKVQEPAESGNAELTAAVQSLEQRKTRMEDTNDIKRLQRAYGYYLDEELWDEMADLFAADGTIEIALDGVYKGKKRVREYLYALGKGKRGLSPGQLNEHMQLMPVVDIAADGKTAKGTWRAVILAGQLGKEAFWSEGPYENEYVKEDGVWKIRRLHWFQTLFVPYEGGWAPHADVNGGKFVGDRLKADAPPSIAYKTWPGAFTPPFHFKDAPPIVPLPPVPETAATQAQLAQRAATLAHEVQLLADQNEIENLQRIYGFYIDKGQWNQAAALFTDDAQFEIGGRGVFKGKARVLDYLRAIGPAGAAEGRLYDMMQLQPVVHVAPDGRTAKGRWHLFAQLAQSGKFHEWSTGIYENDYLKQDGVWKIARLHLYPTMTTPYGDGWGKTALDASSLEPGLKPDAPPTRPSHDYRTVFVPPFHYQNPVSDTAAGRRLTSGTRRPAAEVAADGTALRAQLAAIEQRLARIEDVAQIENLQTSYGYYLSTLLWDPLANLFAEDGTIEIALRGVYVGRPAVRRNLNLYGQAGLDDGVLHNHMQFQMVIHVAEDGKTARLRSRALSMMGNFGKSSMWMGGVYENQFVKLNGVWKFHKDQVVNTYFAPYETGWKDLKLRPAPGITDSNPPDRPPTFHFDLYPKNFLLPYHYPNPVTGQTG